MLINRKDKQFYLFTLGRFIFAKNFHYLVFILLFSLCHEFCWYVHFSIKRQISTVLIILKALQGMVYAVLLARGTVESSLTLTLVRLVPLYCNMHPEGHFVPVKS